MKRLATVFCLLSLCSAEANAWDYQLSSSTHFRGYARPGAAGSSSHMPFYEFVRLRAQDLGLDGLSVQASVWGQLELMDVIDDRATGDVGTLMLQYRAPYESALSGLRVKLGRQYVSAGPSIMEQLDGGMVAYDLPFGLQVAAFGGVPTGIRFTRQPWIMGQGEDDYGYNWVVGGRVGYRFRELAAVGLAYRYKSYRGLVGHNELGWDLTAAPLSWLEVIADGVFELTAERLREVRAGVLLHPMRQLDLELGYRFVSPDLYVPRSSIFAVFSDDVHQQAYVEAHWSRWRWLAVTAEVGARIYDESCSVTAGKEQCDEASVAINGSLRAMLKMGPDGLHRVVLEVERLGAPDGGITRFRLGGRAPVIAGLSMVVEADAYLLDDEHDHSADGAHGASYSFAGSGYLSYDLPFNLSVLAGGQGMITPIFSRAGSFMVRLNWLIDGPAKQGAVKVQRSAMSSGAGGVL